MRALLGLVLVAACHSPAKPDTKTVAWSETTFDDNVRAVIEQRFKGEPIAKLDDDGYRVGAIEVRFTKARHECREAWASCGAAVERTLQAIVDAKHPAPAERSQLRVILRSNDKLASIEAMMKGVTTQPFSSDMSWVLAVDRPTMVGYDVKLDALGLSADEAWKIATENTKPAEPFTAKSGNGAIVYQDVYAPSALRFPELLIATVRKDLPDRPGHLLAVCPEENILLYTIGGELEVDVLRRAAKDGVNESVMPLSTTVMEWTGSAWREAR